MVATTCCFVGCKRQEEREEEEEGWTRGRDGIKGRAYEGRGDRAGRSSKQAQAGLAGRASRAGTKGEFTVGNGNGRLRSRMCD